MRQPLAYQSTHFLERAWTGWDGTQRQWWIKSKCRCGCAVIKLGRWSGRSRWPVNGMWCGQIWFGKKRNRNMCILYIDVHVGCMNVNLWVSWTCCPSSNVLSVIEIDGAHPCISSWWRIWNVHKLWKHTDPFFWMGSCYLPTWLTNPSVEAQPAEANHLNMGFDMR